MGSALSAGVSGLKAFQTMLDVAGNNLANVSTAGYKSSSVSFSDLLSQTIKAASSSSGSLGGTNPVQIGNGVSVSTIKRNMTQGTIESTGEDLDMAIDGGGFFVLNDGTQEVYTRVGSFGVDSDNTLVDPSTGARVQRIGNVGEAAALQTVGDSSIHIPWDTSLAANPTSEIVLNGNLSSSGGTATTHSIVSDLGYTTATGATVATAATEIEDLDQFTGALSAGGTGSILITGFDEDGGAISSSVTFQTGDTMDDLLTQITALFEDSTASLDSEGRIVITGNSAGYSEAQITGMTYTHSALGTDDLDLPTFFDYSTVGGEDSVATSITVYDTTGAEHLLSGVFVKTDETNIWDFVVQSVDGEEALTWTNYDALNRRINGIEFNDDGSLAGLEAGESLTFGVIFSSNPDETQSITLDIGTTGEFDGLTQFYSDRSTASALSQDGYSAGTLSSVSVDSSGIIIGTFSNGVKVDIAQIQLAVFQNAAGLEAVGDNYYITTANSGDAMATTAGSSAGSITSKSLEQSNVDMATEFVNLIRAQNGYQANSRTISVANDILRELTNLIR